MVTALFWNCTCSCPVFSATTHDAYPLQSEAVSKDVKREVKELSRQGWKPVPGTPPLAEQLQQVSSLCGQQADSGCVRIFTASAHATAESIDRAKAMAIEFARQDLATQIESQVEAVTKIKTSNKQRGNGETRSAAKKMTETRVSALQKIGRVKPLIQLYRILPDGNVEVQIRIAYDVNKLIQKEE